MKIALVSPYDFSVPGGVNGHILQLAGHFEREGHTVRILAPASDCQNLLGGGHNVLVVGRPVPLPLSGSVARVSRNPWVGPRLDEVFDAEGFDVVHIHEPFMPWLPFQAMRHSPAVTVGTFHAAKEGGNRFYSYGRRILWRWFARLDGRIAVSPAAASLVERYFPVRCEIIPNGIDVAQFAGPAEPIAEYDDGKTNILFLGRLEKRKGLKYLLRAFARLKSEYPNIRLIVAGEGSVRRHYEASVRRAGLADVVFTGYVSEEEKVRLLHTADIFCAPATANESFGIVLAEAMAAGTPIVATDLEGYASVVRHEREGLLVRPRDERALQKALARLIDNPALRDEMAARAQVRVREFDWASVSRRILAYYASLIEERGARTAATGDAGAAVLAGSPRMPG